MDDSLIGIWGNSRYEGADSGPADELLIFKPDGTGRYEHENYFLDWADLFEWECPAPNLLTLRFLMTLTQDEFSNKVVEKPCKLRLPTVRYTVQDEPTPSGKVPRTLRLQLPGDLPAKLPFPYDRCFADSYALLRADLTGLEDPRFYFTPTPPEIMEFMESLRGVRSVESQQEVIARWAEAGDATHLYQTAIHLESEGASLGIKTWALESVFDRIVSTLAQTPHPGFDYWAVRLSIMPRHATLSSLRRGSEHLRCEIAQLLASGLEGHTLIPLFDAFPHHEEYHETLACLLHEMVLRNFPAKTEERLTAFDAKIRARGYALAWLPLGLLPVEENLPTFTPTPQGRSSPFLGVKRVRPRIRATGQVRQLAAHEVTTPEIAVSIRTSVRRWEEESNGKSEARVFEIDNPLGADEVTPDLLIALALDCLAETPADQIEMRRIHPGDALDSLFVAAAGGGAYTSGWRGAYGRLEAWRSLGALAGAAAEASIEEVMERANCCAWFSSEAKTSWFYNVLNDVGIVCLQPGGTILSVLAATDTD